MRHNKGQKNKPGFTIIEVMIVLAIASVIMLILFLAIPALQRNHRNLNRRNYMGQIAAALDEYKNNNRHYPGPSEQNDFINRYLTSYGALPHGYTIRIFDNTGTVHTMLDEPDVFLIGNAHYCNDSYPAGGEYVTGTPMDSYVWKYVIWTAFEPENPSNYFCLDNTE